MGAAGSTYPRTGQDDGEPDSGGPGSPYSYSIEPVPEGLEQVVYPKYEEAFRLGLEAFTNAIRTNKFHRQLPHLLGTLEFKQDPLAGIVPLSKVGDAAPPQPTLDEIQNLDSPGTGATIGTGSSGFAQKVKYLRDFGVHMESNSSESRTEGSPSDNSGFLGTEDVLARERVNSTAGILDKAPFEVFAEKHAVGANGLVAAPPKVDLLGQQTTDWDANLSSTKVSRLAARRLSSTSQAATVSDGQNYESASSGSDILDADQSNLSCVLDNPKDQAGLNPELGMSSGRKGSISNDSHQRTVNSGTCNISSKNGNEPVGGKLIKKFPTLTKDESLSLTALPILSNFDGGLFDGEDLFGQLVRDKSFITNSDECTEKRGNAACLKGDEPLRSVISLDNGIVNSKTMQKEISNTFRNEDNIRADSSSAVLEDTELANRVYSELLQWQSME